MSNPGAFVRLEENPSHGVGEQRQGSSPIKQSPHLQQEAERGDVGAAICRKAFGLNRLPHALLFVPLPLRPTSLRTMPGAKT